jgi:hypothetical protein
MVAPSWLREREEFVSREVSTLLIVAPLLIYLYTFDSVATFQEFWCETVAFGRNGGEI